MDEDNTPTPLEILLEHLGNYRSQRTEPTPKEQSIMQLAEAAAVLQKKQDETIRDQEPIDVSSLREAVDEKAVGLLRVLQDNFRDDKEPLSREEIILVDAIKMKIGENEYASQPLSRLFQFDEIKLPFDHLDLVRNYSSDNFSSYSISLKPLIEIAKIAGGIQGSSKEGFSFQEDYQVQDAIKALTDPIKSKGGSGEEIIEDSRIKALYRGVFREHLRKCDLSLLQSTFDMLAVQGATPGDMVQVFYPFVHEPEALPDFLLVNDAFDQPLDNIVPKDKNLTLHDLRGKLLLGFVSAERIYTMYSHLQLYLSKDQDGQKAIRKALDLKTKENIEEDHIFAYIKQTYGSGLLAFHDIVSRLFQSEQSKQKSACSGTPQDLMEKDSSFRYTNARPTNFDGLGGRLKNLIMDYGADVIEEKEFTDNPTGNWRNLTLDVLSGYISTYQESIDGIINASHPDRQIKQSAQSYELHLRVLKTLLASAKKHKVEGLEGHLEGINSTHSDLKKYMKTNSISINDSKRDEKETYVSICDELLGGVPEQQRSKGRFYLLSHPREHPRAFALAAGTLILLIAGSIYFATRQKGTEETVREIQDKSFEEKYGSQESISAFRRTLSGVDYSGRELPISDIKKIWQATYDRVEALPQLDDPNAKPSDRFMVMVNVPETLSGEEYTLALEEAISDAIYETLAGTKGNGTRVYEEKREIFRQAVNRMYNLKLKEGNQYFPQLPRLDNSQDKQPRKDSRKPHTIKNTLFARGNNRQGYQGARTYQSISHRTQHR